MVGKILEVLLLLSNLLLQSAEAGVRLSVIRCLMTGVGSCLLLLLPLLDVLVLGGCLTLGEGVARSSQSHSLDRLC